MFNSVFSQFLIFLALLFSILRTGVFGNVIATNQYVVANLENQDEGPKIASKCYNDLVHFLDMLDEPIMDGRKPNGAHYMLDTYGSLSPGIILGNHYWLGDFRGCINAKVMRDNSQEIRFRGKYCVAFVQQLFKPYFLIKMGMCIPSTCTAADMEQISLAFVPKDLVNVVFHPDYCQSLNLPNSWDFTTYVSVFVIMIFVSAVLMATIYDCINGTRFRILLKMLCSRNLSVRWENMLLCFSARRNFKKIFQVNSSTESTIPAIHGLRAFSICWVVIGHTILLFTSPLPFRNMAQTADKARTLLYQPVIGTEYAVDTFFCISGFLAAFGMLDYFAKKGIFKYGMYIFHRLWRLVPPYWLLLIFMIGPYAHAGKSPMYSATHEDQTVCRMYWWKNAFLINIYFNDPMKCLPHVWYLCLDIVYYIFLYPAVTISLHKKPSKGKLIFFGLFLLSFLMPAVLIYAKNLGAHPSSNITPEQRSEFSYWLYEKPWGRMHAVLIGMVIGYLWHKKGKKIQMNLKFVYCAWFCALSIQLFMVYGMLDYNNGTKPMFMMGQIIFGTFAKAAWALSIAWTLYACATGYGGFINSILSWKALVPISRLSYSIYLVHFTVVAVYFASREDGTYLDGGYVIYICPMMIAASIFFGLVINLLAEAPFISMEKFIIPQDRKLKDKKLKSSRENLIVVPRQIEEIKKTTSNKRQVKNYYVDLHLKDS